MFTAAGDPHCKAAMELLESKRVPIAKIVLNYSDVATLQVMDALCKYTS